MKFRALILASAILVSGCGGSESEPAALIAVQVKDFGDSTIAGVAVTAELPPVPQLGASVEPQDLQTQITDANGTAYFELRPDENYRVSVNVQVPSEPECAYKQTTWADSNDTQVTLILQDKVCG